MLDIDTAIKHCLEVAERNTQGLYDAIALGGQNPTQEEIANCEQCAADHRQLAEWLTELKEAKRLLKAAVEDIVWLNEHTVDGEGQCLIETATDMETCLACPLNVNNSRVCGWKHQAEALALIGEEGENDA